MREQTPPHLLSVKQAFNLTPHMRRVVLTGDNLQHFPENHESANFKLFLPRADARASLAEDLTGWRSAPPEQRPVVRTYTLRDYNAAQSEITVDFMLHRDHGPASQWAAQAAPGDQVGFAGPGKPKLAPADADWYLFAGDMSALPAIAANLERLPQGARGYAVLEVISEEDRQPLVAPPGIEITWVINPQPTRRGTLLFYRVLGLPWLDGTPAVWAAGESGWVQALRNYARERGVPREQLYASGYWQIGMTEDVHQAHKRRV